MPESSEVTPPLISLEEIATPLPGDAPAGPSLRYSDIYERIKATRIEEETLGLPDAVGPSAKGEWQKIVTICSEVLATQSKDLQIGAWMAEALTRLHGFAGLRDGIAAIRVLHERFWDAMHPQAIGEDREDRIMILEWADRRFPDLIRRIPLTEGSTPFGLLHHRQTILLDEMMRTRPKVTVQGEDIDVLQEKLDGGWVPREKFEAMYNATSRQFLTRLDQDATACREEFGRLITEIDSRYGIHAPGLSSLREELEEAANLAKSLFGRRMKEIAPESPLDAEGAGGVEGGIAPGPVSGQPRTRAEAIRMLQVAADYLRRTEPHSPVPYLVERAIRWGGMSLDVLITDLVSSSSAQDEIRSLLGILQDRR